MSLESRAGHAAHSIRRSVGSVQPAGIGAITRRHRLGMAAAVAFVGILAGTSVALAAMLPGTDEEPVAATTITAPEAPPTTLPSEPGPPIVVVPAEGEDGNGSEMTLPEGAMILALAQVDAEFASLTGSRWDDWSFGFEGWEYPPKFEEGEIEITAHQYYGPSTGNPYEKIYGTAPPGTPVMLKSSYGSADAVVGESGEYAVKVFFSGQPTNEFFTITAEVGEETFFFQYRWTGSYEVTAMQYYGPVNEVRKDKVYGTAPPGTIVIAQSEYGSSDMVVGSSGEYWLHIYFNESLPANKWITWTATLKNPSGAVLLTKTFEFKWAPPVQEVSASRCEAPKIHTEPWQWICGWAPEGSVIEITSDYGSKEKAIGGEYSAKILFNESLPPHQWIDFTVRIWNEGQVILEKVFEFKWAPASTEASMERCVYPAEYEYAKQKVCGWAPEGAVVELTSEYGVVEQAVTGEYYVKIHFNESLPANTPITWHAKMWLEGEVIIERSYQFTWLAPEGGDVTMAQCVYPNPNSDPWQKICGWAPAGTAIDIISDYGSTEKAVSGEYYVKIHFNESLPANTPITFTARAWIGGEIVKQQSFQFTWTPNFDESATQQYGECSDAEPYDKFYGTGSPGQAVTLTSPYGSASTTVGWDGKWSTKIWFTDPPPNESFFITVQVGDVVWAGEYNFVWVQE